MSRQPFNQLTPKEVELLAALAEEAGEVVQAVTKILRFGLKGVKDGEFKANDLRLAEELGGFLAVLEFCEKQGLVPESYVQIAKRDKVAELPFYLHHLWDVK